MRIVSFVPSWTETLLECGADIVGRTRFCIHPADRVAAIPTVGGTKVANWDRVRSLQPDLVILDREENTVAMAEATPGRFLATHVTSFASCADGCRAIASALEADAPDRGDSGLSDSGWHERGRNMPEAPRPDTVSDSLRTLAKTWTQVARSQPGNAIGERVRPHGGIGTRTRSRGVTGDRTRSPAEHERLDASDKHATKSEPVSRTSHRRELSNAARNQILGLRRWIREPEKPIERLLYLIWSDPWMAAVPNTFIGAVLNTVGLGDLHRASHQTAYDGSAPGDPPPRHEQDRYPRVDLDRFAPETTLILLSSEPFPFEQRIDRVRDLPFPMALVDGEAYSWFGIRSLRALQKHLSATRR